MDGPVRDAIVGSPGLDARLDWVEPTVKSLSIEETAGGPGHGSDGQVLMLPECTLS